MKPGVIFICTMSVQEGPQKWFNLIKNGCAGEISVRACMWLDYRTKSICCVLLFVFQLINQKIRMCTQLYNSRSFVSVLEYLLAIGNYLNENAGKEKAKGFRLSSLTKVWLHHCSLTFDCVAAIG